MSGPRGAERAPDPDTLKEVLRYLDGGASPADVAHLAARLRSSAAERRDVARLLLQVGALEDLAGARAFALPLSVARPSRLRSFAPYIAASALAGAIAAVFLVVRPPDPAIDRVAPPGAQVTATGPRPRRAPHLMPPPIFDRPIARVASLTGCGFATGEGRRQSLEVGASLAAGDGIETTLAPDARVALALVDGTRLELRGEGNISALAAEVVPGQEEPRVRVTFERGRAVATVPARAPGVIFMTPLAEVVVPSGELHLVVESEVTRVRLGAGAAEVRRRSDDHRVALEAGQSLVVSESRALAVEARRALLVRGSDARGAELDQTIGARLEAAGFSVRGVDEGTLAASDFADQALVVISSSSAGQALAARLPATGLRERDVPVINCESLAFIPLGMVSRQGVGPGNTQLFIEQPAHPLAAGKSGEVRIAAAPVGATWGLPASSAVTVGTLQGRRRVAVFGYERGAPMFGLAAPARRVSCFLDPRRAGALSADAWELFDAAVRWAVGH